MITDCAVYQGGRRRPGELPLERAYDASQEPDCFVWLGLLDPTAEELAEVEASFKLPEPAVEAARQRHIRPKLAAYDHVLYAVLKTAWYADRTEVISFGQIMLLAGPRFVVSIRQGQASDLAGVRKELEAQPDLLAHGTGTVLHAIVDRVVDDYTAVLTELDTDLLEVEEQVFSPEFAQPTERIYRLKREVLEFQRATAPLLSAVSRLTSGKYTDVPAPVQTYFGDVEHRLLRVVEEIERDSSLLSSMLAANSAQVAMRQNEDMRKISAWVAIVAVPTMIAGIYGMNFDHMPELRWVVGYPLALLTMAGACGLLYWQFRRSGWL